VIEAGGERQQTELTILGVLLSSTDAGDVIPPRDGSRSQDLAADVGKPSPHYPVLERSAKL
jgi:hypothetical protein